MANRVVPESILKEACTPVIRWIQRDIKVRTAAGSNGRYVLTKMSLKLCEEGVTMAGIWEEAEVSDTYGRTLARELEMSPWNYFTERRMEVCARLLLDERLKSFSCANVAGSVGISRYGTFCDQFKDWCGLLPTEFRKNPPPKILQHLAAQDALVEEESGKWTRPPRDFATARPADETIFFLLQATRQAVADDHPEDAVRSAGQALGAVTENGLESLVRKAHAEAGVAHQYRAGHRIQRFDLESAWNDVVQAGYHYASAGRMAPRVESYRQRAFAPADPQHALLHTLCLHCETRLLDDVELVAAFDDVLQPIPLDLPFFQQACDRCYAEVWGHVHRARLGLEPNAWRAAFLVAYCDDPFDENARPCLGVYVHLLEAVEKSAFQNQERRARLAQRAYGYGRRMKHRERETLGHLFYANVLRAKGELEEARRELEAAESGCENSWLEAYRLWFLGALELQAGNLEAAVTALRNAITAYNEVDSHMAGLMYVILGNVYRESRDFPAALQAFETSAEFLDPRRDPFTANAMLPINLAAVLNSLRRYDEADQALDRCDYDRAAHPSAHAMELLNRAASALGRGDAADALPGFEHARELSEGTDQPFYAGLVSLYSVEAHVALGDPVRALAVCGEAFEAFQAAGCDAKTREALDRLADLLRQMEVDATAVVACVRRLARRHGGVLPVPGEDARD